MLICSFPMSLKNIWLLRQGKERVKGKTRTRRGQGEDKGKDKDEERTMRGQRERHGQGKDKKSTKRKTRGQRQGHLKCGLATNNAGIQAIGS